MNYTITLGENKTINSVDCHTILGFHIQNGIIPDGHYTISESQYNWLIENYTPFIYWDIENNEAVEDVAAAAQNDLLIDIKKLRDQLRNLSIEIDLAERMAEDTTILQNEFNQKKAEYLALINNNIS